jgi:hypothetical protein
MVYEIPVPTSTLSTNDIFLYHVYSELATYEASIVMLVNIHTLEADTITFSRGNTLASLSDELPHASIALLLTSE